MIYDIIHLGKGNQMFVRNEMLTNLLWLFGEVNGKGTDPLDIAEPLFLHR